MVGDETVGEPDHQEGLQEGNDKEKVVSQFTGPLRHVRLDGETQRLNLGENMII